jgi:hypothetical protein
MRDVALALGQQARAADPEALARELHMLISGSTVRAERGAFDSARQAREIARLVLERAAIAP